MAKLFTARQVGEVLDLPHLEVIRRIRRGDIIAKKLGWNWVIEEDAVDKARGSDWYQRHLARQTTAATD
jgi:hypothetical protein